MSKEKSETTVMLSAKCRITSNKPLEASRLPSGERYSIQPFLFRFYALKTTAKTLLTQHYLF